MTAATLAAVATFPEKRRGENEQALLQVIVAAFL
jgi:hypothetical protein